MILLAQSKPEMQIVFRMGCNIDLRNNFALFTWNELFFSMETRLTNNWLYFFISLFY